MYGLITLNALYSDLQCMKHFIEYFNKQPPWVAKYIANLLLRHIICF